MAHMQTMARSLRSFTSRRYIRRPVKLREFETLQRFNGENMASIGVPSNGSNAVLSHA